MIDLSGSRSRREIEPHRDELSACAVSMRFKNAVQRRNVGDLMNQSDDHAKSRGIVVKVQWNPSVLFSAGCVRQIWPVERRRSECGHDVFAAEVARRSMPAPIW
ncbi:MAG: hypothetical protein NXI04_12145 [Planctomycetaceae bacterium]|nr:hypothetical protein [Planctomycetaceae bacterium]